MIQTVEANWSIENLLATVRDSENPRANDDAYTVEEIAEAMGHDEKWVRKRLARLKEAGQIEVVKVRRYRLDEQPYLAPAYRLTNAS